jgi:hypothetical protein
LGFSTEGLGYSIQIRTLSNPIVASETLFLVDESHKASVFDATAIEAEDLLRVRALNEKAQLKLSAHRSVLSRTDDLLPLYVDRVSKADERKWNKLRSSLERLEDIEKIKRLDELTTNIRSNQGNLFDIFKLSARTICASLKLTAVFEVDPKTMRTYERIGNRTLARNGSNLAAVLYALKNGTAEEQASLQRILGWIKQLPEEPYKSFEFVTTDLHDVIFGLRETKSSPLVDARMLSDGTLRCLAVLVALETAELGARVILEEFDNGLHPSRVGVLTQAAWDCAQRRRLNVLVTTHNPATLDSLTEEQLAGVVLCFWDKKQKASRLLPLLELPRADVLLERGHLGDLVTRRILEQHLVPGFEEHQKQKATEWLKALP